MPEQILGKALGRSPEDPLISTLGQYCQWLMIEGERFGVTALDEPEKVARELILDSLSSRELWAPGQRLLDLGSGGGIPGVPLALILPETKFYLLEANQKKCRFLQATVEEFNLEHVEIINSRAELAAREQRYRATFDGVLAKAVASLRVLVELAIPFLKVGGRLVAHKGPKLDEELLDARKAMGELRTKCVEARPYQLGEKSYRLAVLKKLEKTPKAFPRRNGIPAKKPL